MNKKFTFAPLVYALICNFPVSFMLTLTCQLISSPTIDWTLFMINWGVGYAIALFVSLFFPLVNIGRWFTAKCSVDNKTYQGNLPYRLLATLCITMVFFLFVTPSLTVLNYFLIPGSTVEASIDFLLRCIFPLIMVGFCVSLVSDYIAYHVAHKIDPNF